METKQVLFLADNLSLMKDYIKQGKESIVDLIYIDPPFNSKRNYNIVFSDSDATEQAFTDIWSNVSYLDELEEINSINPNLYSFLKNLESTGLQKSMLSYLTAMGIRLYYMRRLLKDTGSIYYHCDPTASHYIKIVMDYVFGIKNFRNEIVWRYNTRTMVSNWYAKKHDIIFFYTKSDSYTFNEHLIRVPHSEDSLKQYNKVDENGRKYKAQSGGLKTYLNEDGQNCPSVWDIQILGSRSPERLGYPTQKPEALLERIIKASSNEGDLVMDFYNGGGTTGAVCKKLNRNYLGVDINYRAIQISQERLTNLGCVLKKDLVIYGIPRSSVELRKMVSDNILGTNKNSRFDLEDVTVKYYLKDVIGNDVKVNDSSIDGTFGFDYQGKKMKGLVQVTSGSNKNHLKAFCSEIGKGTGDLGVYICFKSDVTDGFIQEVKSYGKLGDVDKIQILTFEDLIDNKLQFKLPK
jgi:site-specific DNA-methyltransferase (adenine-specific)